MPHWERDGLSSNLPLHFLHYLSVSREGIVKKSILILFLLALSACNSTGTIVDNPSVNGSEAYIVVDRFQLLGLPVGNGQTVQAENLVDLPKSPVDVFEFQVPAECNECMGRVYVFNSVSDMEAVLASEQRIPSIGNGQATWLFPQGTTLLQLDGRVPGEWADRYREGLQSLALEQE
jgi:hypothetical protein